MRSASVMLRFSFRVLQGYLVAGAICAFSFCWLTQSTYHAINMRIPGIQTGISAFRGQWSQTMYFRWFGWDCELLHSTSAGLDWTFSKLRMKEGFYFSHISTSPQKIRFAFPLWAAAILLSAWPMATFILYLKRRITRHVAVTKIDFKGDCASAGTAVKAV